MNRSQEKNWYALYTRPRWEKKVAALLGENDIEHYCPIIKVVRQWSDRKKVVLEPVFKGYVFIYVTVDRLWESLKINGILNVVRHIGKPAIIKEDEINTIKKFLNEFDDVEVNNTEVTENSKVRIRKGVLMNYEGIVVEVFGNRAFVKIDSLGLQLSAHFDKNNLERVGPASSE